MRHSVPPFMSIGLFQKKSKEGMGWWYMYISEKALGIYIYVTLPLWNKLSPLKIPQICATPLGNCKTKNPRTMENPHDFFLINPRKSTLKISACLFKYPLKFHVLSSPYLVFFWNRGEIRGRWIRKYQVLFFMLRQLKTTDSLRNSDEVVWNLAISEANFCRGYQNGFFKTTKHFWKILWNLQRKNCARASFKNILQL